MNTYDIIIAGGQINGKRFINRVTIIERLDGDDALQSNSHNEVITLKCGSVISYNRHLDMKFSDTALEQLERIIATYTNAVAAHNSLPIEQQYVSAELANEELDAKNAIKAIILEA